jgi:hypothetical protein
MSRLDRPDCTGRYRRAVPWSTASRNLELYSAKEDVMHAARAAFAAAPAERHASTNPSIAC